MQNVSSAIGFYLLFDLSPLTFFGVRVEGIYSELFYVGIKISLLD